jgi:hypothetical protein
MLVRLVNVKTISKFIHICSYYSSPSHYYYYYYCLLSFDKCNYQHNDATICYWTINVIITSASKTSKTISKFVHVCSYYSSPSHYYYYYYYYYCLLSFDKYQRSSVSRKALLWLQDYFLFFTYLFRLYFNVLTICCTVRLFYFSLLCTTHTHNFVKQEHSPIEIGLGKKRRLDVRELQSVQIVYEGVLETHRVAVAYYLQTVLTDLKLSLERFKSALFPEEIIWSGYASLPTQNTVICITVKCNPCSNPAYIEELSSWLKKEVVHLLKTSVTSQAYEIFEEQIQVLCSGSCRGIVLEWSAMPGRRVQIDTIKHLEEELWKSFCNLSKNSSLRSWVWYWKHCARLGSEHVHGFEGPGHDQYQGSVSRDCIRSYFVFKFPEVSKRCSFLIHAPYYIQDDEYLQQYNFIEQCIQRFEQMCGWVPDHETIVECLHDLKHVKFLLDEGSIIVVFKALSLFLAEMIKQRLIMVVKPVQNIPEWLKSGQREITRASNMVYTTDASQSTYSVTLLSLGPDLIQSIYRSVHSELWYLHAGVSKQLCKILSCLRLSLHVLCNRVENDEMFSESISSEMNEAADQQIPQCIKHPYFSRGKCSISWSMLLSFMYSDKYSLSMHFISELDLTSCKIGVPGAKIIAKHICSDNLCRFQLLDNNIGKEGMHIIASSHLLSAHMSWLGLGSNNLCFEGMNLLCSRLSECPGLLGLDLSDNTLFDNTSRNMGAQLLGSTLVHLSSMCMLQLQGNQLYDEGAKLLLQTWQNRARLTHLDLRNNNLSPGFGSSLMKLLDDEIHMIKLLEFSSKDTKLACLNQLPICFMRSSLQSNSISILNLSYARLGPAEACVLCDFLKNGLQCIGLFLRGNALRSDGAKIMAEGLFASNYLRLMDVGSNMIGSSGLSALKASSGDQKMVLMDNNIHEPVDMSCQVALILLYLYLLTLIFLFTVDALISTVVLFHVKDQI